MSLLTRHTFCCRDETAFKSHLFESVGSFAFTGGTPGRLVVEAAGLGRGRVARVRSTGHRIALEEPHNLTLLMPLHGALRVETRRRSLDARAGETLLVPPSQRTTLVGPRFVGLVAMAPLNEIATALDGEELPADTIMLRPPSAATIGEPGAQTLDGFLRFIVAEGDRDSVLLARPRAQAAAFALLVEFLAAALAEREAAIGGRRREAAARPAKVRDAEELMRQRLDEPLAVSEIARVLDVSVRGLQLAFQKSRGKSPRAVLLDIRLETARRRLLTSGPADSVTDIALGCGFNHVGRFAASYRVRFGEAPSATLRRALDRS